MRTALKAWLLPVTLATLLALTAYAAIHQALRLSANDPQIQLAQDWADAVASGTDPGRLSLGNFIDPARSLAPFGIVYDEKGSIINSSVSAPSSMQQPEGVFGSVEASAQKEVRFTWQPVSGERYAAVIKKTTFDNKTYYILSGRNLREVDVRNMRILHIMLLGWVLSLGITVLLQHTRFIGKTVRRIRDKRNS